MAQKKELPRARASRRAHPSQALMARRGSACDTHGRLHECSKAPCFGGVIRYACATGAMILLSCWCNIRAIRKQTTMRQSIQTCNTIFPSFNSSYYDFDKCLLIRGIADMFESIVAVFGLVTGAANTVQVQMLTRSHCKRDM